jgi:transcription initiation factor TFIIIB Brf1 subunit/transcription initiation factor TFIIB
MDESLNNINKEIADCEHKNIKLDGGYFVCQDCGLIDKDKIAFEKTPSSDFYSDSQIDYERKIRIGDSRAIQDPKTKARFEQIKILNTWFKDSQSSFTEQKKTISMLKSYGIGLSIDKTKYNEIKYKYIRYNKYHRQTYENMVIIFLAIIWMEIKETTNVRIEDFIKASKELGHKINKKMLNNAMLKVKRTDKRLKGYKTANNLEEEIKKKIKILFQKDLNNIKFERVEQHFSSELDYTKLKLEMQLLVDKILQKINYKQILNLNYKAFTAGLIYYIGQTLDNRKIFTQSIVEQTSRFSSTTIRKKHHFLVDILGNPSEFNL